MFQEWPGISEARRRSIGKRIRFMTRHGFGPECYAYVADAAPPMTARFVVHYGVASEHGLDARMERVGIEDNFALFIDANFAWTVLMAIAADAEFRAIAYKSPFTVDIASALADFGVGKKHVKPHVAAWETGAWIARDNNDYSVFDVAPPGEVSSLAKGNAFGAAFVISAYLRAEHLQLARLADAEQA